MTPGDFSAALTALHLLRPQWLWALLALPLLAAWWRARRRRASIWRGAVDAHLLPHLLDATPAGSGRWTGMLAAVGYGLAVVALAGPSWRQVEQPLWQSQAPLVIAIDLSSATLAPDLPPTRLAQARAKLGTLLRDRDGGQVGLVAYAGDAFTVAPLTDDAGNVALFLDALAPSIMPVDGQRSDRAIAWSATLLRQAGFQHGDILLLTDHADAAARTAAAAASAAGYRVLALGLGSATGASYQRPDGSIASAGLDAASLRGLAAQGGGRYATLTATDDDLDALGVLTPADAIGSSARGETGRAWQDGGYWLLPPLMLLALFAFRRRPGLMALLFCALLPWQAVLAADPWRRPDQQAYARLQEAGQAYRKGEFARAAQLYEGIDTATAHYNRGNALAKAGQYPQAIKAYDQALSRKRMDDALANKRAVEAAMKRKPPPGGGQNRPKSGGQDAKHPATGSGEPDQKGEPPPDQQQTADSPGKASGKPLPQEAKVSDAQAQEEADAAQRDRMQRALDKASGKPRENDKAAPPPQETAAQRERRIANEAWLKRVPDDPGGLLRAKFRIEYERRQMSGQGE